MPSRKTFSISEQWANNVGGDGGVVGDYCLQKNAMKITCVTLFFTNFACNHDVNIMSCLNV